MRRTSGTPWTVQRVLATSSGLRVLIRLALTSTQHKPGKPRKSRSERITSRLCDAFSSSRDGSHVCGHAQSISLNAHDVRADIVGSSLESSVSFHLTRLAHGRLKLPLVVSFSRSLVLLRSAFPLSAWPCEKRATGPPPSPSFSFLHFFIPFINFMNSNER
jgi:hypothetical protein